VAQQVAMGRVRYGPPLRISGWKPAEERGVLDDYKQDFSDKVKLLCTSTASPDDKTPGEMEKLYTYDSTIFNPFAQRTESGRVSAARKDGNTSNQTSFRAEVTVPSR